MALGVCLFIDLSQPEHIRCALSAVGASILCLSLLLLCCYESLSIQALETDLTALFSLSKSRLYTECFDKPAPFCLLCRTSPLSSHFCSACHWKMQKRSWLACSKSSLRLSGEYCCLSFKKKKQFQTHIQLKWMQECCCLPWKRGSKESVGHFHIVPELRCKQPVGMLLCQAHSWSGAFLIFLSCWFCSALSEKHSYKVQAFMLDIMTSILLEQASMPQTMLELILMQLPSELVSDKAQWLAEECCPLVMCWLISCLCCCLLRLFFSSFCQRLPLVF